ncbi:auxin-responsive protein SAUR71-like protein [Tanacetum coccineum]
MKKLIRRLARVSHSSAASHSRVPEGYLPVYVGDEMERFVVSADLLNHPVFINLLNKSAQEYGYQQKGVLRIPCHVLVFQRVLDALRLGQEAGSCDLQHLLSVWSVLMTEVTDVSFPVLVATAKSVDMGHLNMSLEKLDDVGRKSFQD